MPVKDIYRVMDVIELRQFYTTPLGVTVRRLVSHRLRQRPRPPAGSRVLGLGFAAPWLDGYRNHRREVFSFMPAHQGVIHWPAGGPSDTALVDEAALPLPDGSIDLALVAHGLELTHDLSGMLSELWRVLGPRGHALFIVPNRRGLWARIDSTPFGHGRPFSRGQLDTLLRNALFTPTHWQPALFVPPTQRRMILRSATAWERLGLSLWQGFSGLIIVDAIKQVYALRKDRKAQLVFPDLKPSVLPAPALGAARNSKGET